MEYRRLEGIITALITPFDNEGRVNYEILRSHIEILIEGGVDALYPLGTTGEFPLLSQEERKKVAEEVVKAVRGRVPVVIQTGDDNIKVVEELILHAKSIGADGVAVVTPYYFNLNGDELFTFYGYIAEKYIDIPIYLYNIPQITGISIPVDIIKRLIEKYKNITGIKDSSGDFSYFMELMKLKEIHPDFVVLTGTDKYILSTHQIGADGNVSGFSNCFPEVFSSFRKAFIEGDETNYENIYKKILYISEVLKDGAVIDLIKAVCRLKGENVGYVRMPLRRISKEEERTLKDKLKKLL